MAEACADGSSVAGPFLHYHNNRPQCATAPEKQLKSLCAPPLPTHSSGCSIMLPLTPLLRHSHHVFYVQMSYFLLLFIFTELCWTVRVLEEVQFCWTSRDTFPLEVMNVYTKDAGVTCPSFSSCCDIYHIKKENKIPCF